MKFSRWLYQQKDRRGPRISVSPPVTANAPRNAKPAACMNGQHLPLPPPWTEEILSEYVDALIEFVTEYRSIAGFNSQHVFTQGLPVDWAPKYTVEEWLSIISGQISDEILPVPLARFIRLAKDLPLVGTGQKPESTQVQLTRKRFTPQKSHEVHAFVEFVREMTKSFNVDVERVVDVGAGLGYLSQELAKTGFQVVAIEGDPGRAAKAAHQANVQCIAKMVNGPDDLDIAPDPCLVVSLRMVPREIMF